MTSFADLRDKSPQVNHNKDINLACFKLNGVLDGFESVLIPIVFFFQGMLMHNEHSNDVLALSVASFLAWETFED